MKAALVLFALALNQVDAAEEFGKPEGLMIRLHGGDDKPADESALVAQEPAKVLAMVKAAQAELIKYYEGDSEIMEKAVVQAVRKADDVLIARMALIMMGKRKKEFIIAAGGSSVTAGHDGFGDASWPSFTERQLAPIWKALGVKFEVRNHAIGGRNPNPWGKFAFV
jgi:hypothetical protein